MNRSMAALVMGNGAYRECDPLRNPVNDARDMAERLASYGFNVILATDATGLEMDRKLREFRRVLASHDVGLFFFAGHGMQIEGTNYLLATDTDTSTELDAKHGSLPLDKVLEAMALTQASTKIVILDACRNNPWERAWSRDAANRGLASVYAPKGTIIGFATSPGEVAKDGSGRNGTYTAALLQHIDTPDSSLETMFKRVRNTVAAETRGKQTSWEHTSLAGEFYFNLSLGKMIPEYRDTSLADALLILDPARKSHRIIQGLKTHNWYKQNAVLAEVDARSVANMTKNSLFVIGRNFYQSACGGANAAIYRVNNFLAATHGFADDRRKAILDGMLFEIFFDSQGKVRESIKDGFFDQVFELQRHEAFAESFEFISGALLAARAKFHVLPGRNHELAVTIATKEAEGALRIDAVFIGGVNVLRPQDDEWDVAEGDRLHGRTNPTSLTRQLSIELVVPSRSLQVTFTPPLVDERTELQFPQGWTVRKG